MIAARGKRFENKENVKQAAPLPVIVSLLDCLLFLNYIHAIHL